MSANVQINPVRYGKLLSKTLPRPIRDEQDNQRMTKILLDLDERPDLPPKRNSSPRC